jgi:hypothetical protein
MDAEDFFSDNEYSENAPTLQRQPITMTGDATEDDENEVEDTSTQRPRRASTPRLFARPIIPPVYATQLKKQQVAFYDANRNKYFVVTQNAAWIKEQKEQTSDPRAAMVAQVLVPSYTKLHESVVSAYTPKVVDPTPPDADPEQYVEFWIPAESSSTGRESRFSGRVTWTSLQRRNRAGWVMIESISNED